jgi:hypothetical protein
METWRAIPGFEGRYEVSSEGRIRRIGKGRGVVPGRVLKTQPLPAGYRLVPLWKDNVQHMQLVHILVAAAFHGPCPAGHEVNHKNLVNNDNRSDNLEYLTRSANLLHRAAAGVGRGERNGTNKLSEAAVVAIRERHANGEGYKNLGKAYGVSWECIRNIVKRRVWAWVA